MRSKARIVIVSGATKGIGYSIATTLALKGIRVGALGRDFDEAIYGWSKKDIEIIEPIVVDLVKPRETIVSVVQWLEKQNSQINALINNAVYYGEGGRHTVLETSLDEWERIYAINVHAVFYLTKAVLPFIVNSGKGMIINIASQIASLPAPGRVGYGSSKAAVDSITKGLAVELENSNISVVGVHPGVPVITPGIIHRRPEGFNDYTGFLESDVLDELILKLIENGAKKFSGKILSPQDFVSSL